jgi:hypothetical protein
VRGQASKFTFGKRGDFKMNSKQNTRFESRYAHLPVMEEREVGRPKYVNFRKNPIVAGQLEYLVQPIFDFYGVAVATLLSKQQLFATAIGSSYTPTGGAAFIKTGYHTNLVQNGMLDAPKKFLVKAPATLVRSDVAVADLNAFVGQTQFDLFISGKNYWSSVVSKTPAGAGAFASGAAITTAAGTSQTSLSGANGWPSAQNVASITDPMPQIPGLDQMEPILGQLIEQNQNFSVILDPTITGVAAFTTVAAGPTAGTGGVVGTGINAHVYLEGVLARAIL